MAITLAIADNLDGTGGVATVAGSNVASSNTLYKATWTGQTGQLTWASVGSRTGDGTISISSATGFFLFRLDNLLSGTTTVVTTYQPLTDEDEEAILYRAMGAAATRIEALALGVNIDRRWLPRSQQNDSNFPILAISPAGGETYPGILTGQDDIGLAFSVVLIDKQNQDPYANLNRNLLWRWKILKALRFQRLAGVPEGYILNPEPSVIVHEGAFDQQNLMLSPLVFRLITRTTRG